MNLQKMFSFSLTLLFCFTMFSASIAQFDDEFGEVETEDIICIPENLQTLYDSKVYADSTQPIGLIYNFGYEYYKNKSYKDALPYLWRVFNMDSTKYARNAIRYISRIYFDQGMVDSTLIACYRGLDKFPNIITLHYYAGILQNKLGKSVCAIPHYEELVKDEEEDLEKTTNDEAKKESFTENLKTLAYLYYKTEDERAIELQQQAVNLNPDNAELAKTLAQYSDYFYGKGAGTAAYRQAWLNDPENLDLALKYGEAAAQSDTVSNALEPLNKVINKKPSKKAYEIRASVYENLGQYNNAISDLKKALDFKAIDLDVMIKIAEDYKLANNFSSAQYWVNRALKTRPGFGQAHITMGEIYEAAVLYCMGQRNGDLKYEDKLVYELAYNEYEKAQKDPAFRSKAKTKQNYVLPLIPTKEDKFMNKGVKIKSSCYTNWIN
jgi:tetratricopeptide (TPR) repeat protein